MELTSQQNEIIQVYESTNKNIQVCAGPGAGKSFILKELAKRTPKGRKVLFMAFNKSIAEELKEKLPETTECSTYHSKGLRLLLKNFNFKPNIDENKCFKMIMKHFNLIDISEDRKMQFVYAFNLQTIWDQLRTKLTPTEEFELSIKDICTEKDIDYDERMIDDLLYIKELWLKDAKRINSKDTFNLDFVDMIYLPIILIDPLMFPKYDVVFIDEQQDSNPLQKQFILNSLKRNGRFVCVGDKKQLIYHFQSSDIDVFESFGQMRNTISLPLSVTFRCAKKIVEEANKVFPEGTQPSPSAEDGIVRQGKLDEAQSGDFVLCRNNLPLIQAFIKFLSQGKKCYILGTDYGEQIARLIEDCNSIASLDNKLQIKKDKLKEKGYNNNQIKNNPSYIALEEKVKIVKLLCEKFYTFNDLKTRISEIFKEKGRGIVLSTIHKSKGLETDRVFFLNENLIPSEHAITEKALYAERCLRFVAVTRAKKELIYCVI